MSLVSIKMENETEQNYVSCNSYSRQSLNDSYGDYERENMSPYSNSVSGSPPGNVPRCKRRILFGHKGQDKYSDEQSTQAQPPSVVRRNERERNRVRMVNNGFVTLRQHVPNGVKNKKMSKVETLKSAVDYIKELQQLLMQGETSSPAYSSMSAEVDVKAEENTDDWQSDTRVPVYPPKRYSEADFKQTSAATVSYRDGHSYENYGSHSYNVPSTYPTGQSSFYSSNGSPALSWPSDTSSPGSQCHQEDDENMLAFSSWFQ